MRRTPGEISARVRGARAVATIVVVVVASVVAVVTIVILITEFPVQAFQAFGNFPMGSMVFDQNVRVRPSADRSGVPQILDKLFRLATKLRPLQGLPERPEGWVQILRVISRAHRRARLAEAISGDLGVVQRPPHLCDDVDDALTGQFRHLARVSLALAKELGSFEAFHRPLHQRMQVCVIDLLRPRDTTSMMEQDVPFPADHGVHLLGKVGAEPVKHDDDGLRTVRRCRQSPLKEFDHVLDTIRAALLELQQEPRR